MENGAAKLDDGLMTMSPDRDGPCLPDADTVAHKPARVFEFAGGTKRYLRAGGRTRGRSPSPGSHLRCDPTPDQVGGRLSPLWGEVKRAHVAASSPLPPRLRFHKMHADLLAVDPREFAAAEHA